MHCHTAWGQWAVHDRSSTAPMQCGSALQEFRFSAATVSLAGLPNPQLVGPRSALQVFHCLPPPGSVVDALHESHCPLPPGSEAVRYRSCTAHCL